MVCERIFIKTHSIESRCDIEPENRLFAGMSVHFEPGNFTGWGSERVKGYRQNTLLMHSPLQLRNLQLHMGFVGHLVHMFVVLSVRCAVGIDAGHLR